jgi:hypothetical protein
MMYLSYVFSLSVGAAAGVGPALVPVLYPVCRSRAGRRPVYVLILGVDAERTELEAGVPAVFSEEVEDRAVFLLVLLEMLGGAVVTESQELLGNVVYSGCDFFACHSLVVLSFVVTLFICFYKDIKFF